MGGDDDGGRPVQGRGLGGHGVVSRRPAQRQQRPGDRRVAVNGDERRGHHGFQEDLQGPTGQARVVGGHRARPVDPTRLLLGGGDPQQQALAGIEQGQALGPDGRFGARPTDESFHRAVGQDQRLVAGLDRRGPLGPHHPGVHERDPLALQRPGPLVHLGLAHPRLT